LKVWRDEELETRTSSIPDSEAVKVIQAYNLCNGNINRAARYTGYSWPTIKRHWKKARLID